MNTQLGDQLHVQCTDLRFGRGPVGNLAVLRLCLTRTEMHHTKITPMATSSKTDRLTAIATMVRTTLPLLDCTPGAIEEESNAHYGYTDNIHIHISMHTNETFFANTRSLTA